MGKPRPREGISQDHQAVSDKDATASASGREMSRGSRSFPDPYPSHQQLASLRPGALALGMGCPGLGEGGLVKKPLAVPGLASLLSYCVWSNPTLEWAGRTFEPRPTPTPIPRPGLTLPGPAHQILYWWWVVSSGLLDTLFILKTGQEILWGLRGSVEFQVSLVTAIFSFGKVQWFLLCLSLLRTGALSCGSLHRSLLISGPFSLPHSQGA